MRIIVRLTFENAIFTISTTRFYTVKQKIKNPQSLDFTGFPREQVMGIGCFTPSQNTEE